MLAFYSEFGIKPIQRDWNGFFAASVCEGTASQKKSFQFSVVL